MSNPHCWKGYRDHLMETHGDTDGELRFIHERQGGDPYAPKNDMTCMLLDGHDGPHEWTPDSEITVRFVEPADA